MAETLSFFIKISDNGTFKKVEVDADSLRTAVEQVKEETDRLNSSVVNWSQASQAIDLLQQSFSELKGVVSELSSAYSVQEVAEQKLANNMRNTMGARDEDIQSIKDLCSAQQALGVIGDEVQLSGAQELATYLEKKSSLEKLIPVMNDMLAQQYGLNASEESAAQIASMLGKVMDGQVGALSRYGYKFDEAQEQILRFGTEEARAAVLAEVVESSVGGMNAELARTDSGRQQQLANDLGDLKERLGSLVQGIAPLLTIASELVIVAAGALKCVTTMQALAASFHLASLKSAILAVHERVQSAAQNLLTSSSWTATAGTWALNAAVAALYATLTMGISLVISGIVALLSSTGEEAEDAAEEIDVLKESNDAFSNTVSATRGEIDMEIVSLQNLMKNHGDTTKKVEELNRKYGEAFGYHRTAAEWYDALVTKSKAYCMQLGYEAQAKVLASQIAAKELERDAKVQQQFMGRQQYWDSKGNIHYNWEQWEGGEAAYKALSGEIAAIDQQLGMLRGQYDSCTSRMTAARQEVESQAAAASVAGKSIAIEAMTYDELGRAINENNTKLSSLAPTESAEIERLKRLNKQLQERKKHLGSLLGLEKPSKGNVSKAKSADGDDVVASPKTYTELSNAVSAYEKRLKETNPAEEGTIRLLTEEIRKYREKKNAVEQMLHNASRPAELKTLEEIDSEIQYQQMLRKRATADSVSGIDEEIKRLNALRRAFEENAHVAVGLEQIHTYEQLEAEITFYESKLKHATETERTEIQKQIIELERLRSEWDATLSELEAPEDVSRLNSISELERAISYYSERQKKASASEIEDIQRSIDELTEKREALERLTQLPGMERELSSLSGKSGKKLTMELELVGAEGIKSKIRDLQKMLDDTKNPLGAEQRKEVEKLMSSWKGYEKQLKKSQANLRDAWGDIKGIGSGIDSITAAIEGSGSAWERVTGVIDGVLSIYDGLSGVISIVEMLTGVSAGHAAAKGVEAAAETEEGVANAANAAAAVTASGATAAALGVETAAWSALAAAKTFAAHAYIPFAGTAIASGYISAQQSVILAAAIPKFADGAIAYGPTLGIFGEYANAGSNPEVVAPLDKLRGLIGDGGMGGKVEFRIKGRRLVGVLEKEYNRRKRS